MRAGTPNTKPRLRDTKRTTSRIVEMPAGCVFRPFSSLICLIPENCYCCDCDTQQPQATRHKNTRITGCPAPLSYVQLIARLDRQLGNGRALADPSFEPLAITL